MSRVLILGALPESLVRFRGDLINSLRYAGHEVVAAAGGADPSVEANLRERGVSYHSVRMQRTGMNPFKDLVSLREYYFLMREVSPDVVLCYTAKPVIYGLLAARWARVPRSAAMIEGLGFAFTGRSLRQRLLAKLMVLLYHASMAKCLNVFFLNPDDQIFFNAEIGFGCECRQTRLNGIGVDLDYFCVRPLPPSPTFLLVARLLKDKGVMEYFAAAEQVKRRYPAASFLLVGWLDENPSAIGRVLLDEWIRSGFIQYRGHLSDVRSAYEDCSVYVLPSYREGFPVTIMEAMAMGRAVVTTDVPGCREAVVEGVNGFIVPAKDSEALAGALMRFLENPELAIEMGRESRRLAEASFDVHAINRQILEALNLN